MNIFWNYTSLERMLSRTEDSFVVFIRLFSWIERTRVLGNLLAFPKGESDAWHETRQALAELEHEGAGWTRWDRGGIKRANYGFAMDSEEEEKKEKRN